MKDELVFRSDVIHSTRLYVTDGFTIPDWGGVRKQKKMDIIRLKQAQVESENSNCVKHSVGCIMLRSDPKSRIGGTVYVNLQPCEECAKMIAGSGVSRVVYGKVYERSDKSFSESFFGASMIKYIHIPDII